MAPMDTNLVWSPIGEQLVSRCATEGGIRLLIAPFIQRKSLAYLLDALSSHSDLKIITRWTAKDIASGVSDPFVYEECTRRGLQIYHHPSIHLKLIIMGSGLCFCGSANITSRGLGLKDDCNMEAGVWSSTSVGDWMHVYRLINESRLIDEAMFDAAVEYRRKHKCANPPLPPIEFPPCPAKEFTLASLPATKDPETLAACVTSSGDLPKDEINRVMHDLVVFGGDLGMSREELLETIGSNFLSEPFVRSIAKHIQESGSLSFGGVTSWIHDHCQDVPIPYRSEVKDRTSALYNWLTHYVPELSWSVPGAYSQVIRWEDGSR